MLTASDADSEATIDYDLSDSMMVEEIQKCRGDGKNPKETLVKKTRKSKHYRDAKFKALFSAIAGMF